MSDSQDNLLNYEGDEVQGEDLLDQSVEGKSLDEDIVMLGEQQADPGLKLACDDNDIFEDGITDTQLEQAVNSPTQEDPEGPAQSP